MAYGQGDINVETFVNGLRLKNKLTDVQYTLDVLENLFSVPSAGSKGVEYWLNGKVCKIIKNGETIATSERHYGYYKLNMRVICANVQVEACVARKLDSLQVWHERLSHPNKQHVEKYLKEHGIDYFDDHQFCERCVLGKQHGLSFGMKTLAPEHPGDLI